MAYSGPSPMKSTRAGPESPRRSKCETSRRQKPREVAVQLVEASRDRDSCGEQDPEAGFPGVFRVQEPTARGERRPGGRTALHEGTPSKGENPRSGTGTRQGRQETGGARPRERAKRWGGNMTRGWTPGNGGCPLPGRRRRGTNRKGGSSRRGRSVAPSSTASGRQGLWRGDQRPGEEIPCGATTRDPGRARDLGGQHVCKSSRLQTPRRWNICRGRGGSGEPVTSPARRAETLEASPTP